MQVHHLYSVITHIHYCTFSFLLGRESMQRMTEPLLFGFFLLDTSKMRIHTLIFTNTMKKQVCLKTPSNCKKQNYIGLNQYLFSLPGKHYVHSYYCSKELYDHLFDSPEVKEIRSKIEQKKRERQVSHDWK